MAKPTVKRSKIGYNGIGADGLPVVHYQWEPFGYGCSMLCMRPGKCWAEISAPRQKHRCKKCGNFQVHIHKERLCQPGNTKSARVILAAFHADWMDKIRPGAQIGRVMYEAAEAGHHTYVWLTKNARRLHEETKKTPLNCVPNWYLGLTIRNRPDLERATRDGFFDIPGKKWISYEPGIDEVRWPFDQEYGCGRCSAGGPAEHFMWNEEGDCWQCPDCGDMSNIFTYRNTHGVEGIIIGHDRRKGEPGTDTLSHIRSCVEQCKAAGVAWWVKQIWLWVCPWCDRINEVECDCDCATRPRLKPRLLHASKPFEYALFPEDLREGARLPWSAPKEQSDENP